MSSIVGPVLGLAGDVLGLNQAGKQQKQSQQALDLQRQVAQQQQQLFNTASPYYSQLLQGYASLLGPSQFGYNATAPGNTGFGPPPATPAGPGAPAGQKVAPNGQHYGGALDFLNTQQPNAPAAGSTQVGNTTYAPGVSPGTGAAGQQGGINNTPGVLNSQLGVFNLPQQQLQFAAADEDLNRAAQRNAQNLQLQFGQAGQGNSNTLAAALGHNQYLAQQAGSDFRRQLAAAAPDVYQQRLQALGNALNPGLGQGQLAAGNGQSLGQYFGNQAQNSGGLLGQALNAWKQYQALQNAHAGNTYNFGTLGNFTTGINGPYGQTLGSLTPANPDGGFDPTNGFVIP